MKKKIMGIVIIVLAIAILFTFTACNKYKWGPVGTLEGADKEVINNGSFVVRQGDYLYSINGVQAEAITSVDQNEWGNASIKGSIMKSKIKADGSLECLGVVVPKLFYAGNSTFAGIYVYGDWIYYSTRTIKTDNKGVPVDGIEFMRTKIDGTKTQSILNLEDSLAGYIFTKSGVIYTSENKISYVAYNDKKVEKPTTIVDKYASVSYSKEAKAIFYVKAEENLVSGQTIGVVEEGGKKTEIIKPNSYSSKSDYYTDLENQFALAIVKYDASEKVLYYTKTSSDSKKDAGTYSYKFTSGFSFDAKQEVRYTKSAMTTIHTLGHNVAILDVSSANIKAYKPIAKDATEENVSEKLTASTNLNIAFVDKDYVYYLKDAKLYRADLIINNELNMSAYEELVFDQAIGATYGHPCKIGDYVYYEASSESNYIYRFNLTEYSLDNQTMPKGYIVTGYTSHADTEDGKIPTYMTDADKETYVKNHKKAEE